MDEDEHELGQRGASQSQKAKEGRIYKRKERARQYSTRRKKAQFQGKKERLRTQNMRLNIPLSHRKYQSLCKDTTAFLACATKPSEAFVNESMYCLQ